jgi:hypothetical protein
MADLHGLQRAISTHYGNARAGAEARAAAERLLDWWSLDDGALEDVADALAGAAVASRTHPVLRARVFEWAWAHARFVVANDGGGVPPARSARPADPALQRLRDMDALADAYARVKHPPPAPLPVEVRAFVRARCADVHACEVAAREQPRGRVAAAAAKHALELRAHGHAPTEEIALFNALLEEMAANVAQAHAPLLDRLQYARWQEARCDRDASLLPAKALAKVLQEDHPVVRLAACEDGWIEWLDVWLDSRRGSARKRTRDTSETTSAEVSASNSGSSTPDDWPASHLVSHVTDAAVSEAFVQGFRILGIRHRGRRKARYVRMMVTSAEGDSLAVLEERLEIRGNYKPRSTKPRADRWADVWNTRASGCGLVLEISDIRERQRGKKALNQACAGEYRYKWKAREQPDSR